MQSFYHQPAVCQRVAKLTLRQLIAPFLETSFGELHNVSFVHQCHRRQMMVERILARSEERL